MTHRDHLTNDSAEFFALVAYRVLTGSRPVEAMKEIAGERFKDNPVSRWVKAGLESKGEDSVSVISRYGQSCHTNEVFPGVVHLIAKYKRDLEEALVQSVMA